jgi:hypothetical protein
VCCLPLVPPLFFFLEADRNFTYLPRCLTIYAGDRFIYGDTRSLLSQNQFMEAVVLFTKVVKKNLPPKMDLQRKAFIKPFSETGIYKARLNKSGLAC